jgi:hypothetical protein
MEGVHQPSARGHNWVPGFTPSAAWQMAPSAAKHASLGKEEQWCFRGMISWNIMEYHGISWNIMEYRIAMFIHVQHTSTIFNIGPCRFFGVGENHGVIQWDMQRGFP